MLGFGDPGKKSARAREKKNQNTENTRFHTRLIGAPNYETHLPGGPEYTNFDVFCTFLTAPARTRSSTHIGRAPEPYNAHKYAGLASRDTLKCFRTLKQIPDGI